MSEYIYSCIDVLCSAQEFVTSRSLRYIQPEASNLKYNAASMSDQNSQCSTSNTHIPQLSPFISSPCSCCVLLLDEATIPSLYDRWLKPRPNTKWQDLENQRFVDLSQFDDEFVDEDEYELSEEGGYKAKDSSNEMPVGDGSDRGNEDEAHHGPHLAYSNSDRLGAMDEAILSTEYSSNTQKPGSMCQQAPEQETLNEVLPMEQEDDVITKFLTVVEDQDLHRDSTARLKSFLKSATLACLEQCSVEWTGSRILLEDRNFSDKTFRPYPRPLAPKQLYDALRRQVYKPHFLKLISGLTKATAVPRSHLVKLSRYGA